MSFSAKSLPIIISLICLAVFFYPQLTKAEVATANDWLGVFEVGAGDTQADTLNGNSWKSTGNTPTDCLSTLPSSKPWLSGNCGFTLPANLCPGAYEFRLYANYRTDNTPTMLAESKPFWIQFSIQDPPVCVSGENFVTVDLNWINLAGVDPVNYPSTDRYDIYRGPTTTNLSFIDTSYVNSYRDIVQANTDYYYYVIAYTSRGSIRSANIVHILTSAANCPTTYTPPPPLTCGSPLPTPTATPTPTTAPAPTATPTPGYPWLKTSGGDVHSN